MRGLGQFDPMSMAADIGGNLVSGWLGNVFGANNATPIEDIQAALLAGHYSNITSQSWAEAGLPDGGGQWLQNFLIQHGFHTNPLTGEPVTGYAAPAPALAPVVVSPTFGPAGTHNFDPYYGPSYYPGGPAGGVTASSATLSAPLLIAGAAVLYLLLRK